MPDQSSTFRYKTIAAAIRRLIEEGGSRGRIKLPSVRRLARDYGVSPTTALQALRMLESERLVESTPRSGYFTIEPIGQTSSIDKMGQAGSKMLLDGAGGLSAAVLRVSGRFELDMANGAPEFYPAQKLGVLMRQIIHRNPQLLSHHARGTGYEPLKAQIINRGLEYGSKIRSDELLITSGCIESLDLALRATTAPGDTVVVQSPTYYLALQMLKQMHLNIIEIPTTENGIDISYLEMIIRREPVKAGLFTANFNNPTGKTFSEKVKFDLVKLFQHNNIPLIEDDIYGDVHFDRARPRPLRAYSDSVILCSSFSKTLAPGLRVGWVAGAQWFERIASRKSLTSKFTALYPQAVIAEFIRSGGYDNHLRKLREKMLFNVRSMGAAILESFPQGTSVSAPTGGFVLWIGLPLGCAESQTVFERAASEGIGIAPGGLFSLDGSFSTYIRLNAGVGWTPETNLVIKRLASLVLA